ncbi:MAG TPA: phage holin family protein [Pseudonocardiaceae bacterium]
MEFVYRVVATAVAVWVATWLPGISLLTASTPAKVGTLIVIALVFGVVNLVLKPVAHVVGCLLYLVTFGLIGLVVNALLLMLTGWIARQAHLPFEVNGFWPAFWGAIVIAVVSFVLTLPLHIGHLGRRAARD